MAEFTDSDDAPDFESMVGADGLLLEGEQELDQHLKDGYRIVLVVGIPGVGKTQMLASFERQRELKHRGLYLRQFETTNGLVMPTARGTIRAYPVSEGKRKVLFVDAAGELFRRFYPFLRPSKQIQRGEIEFLEKIERNLQGVALLVDLAKLWKPEEGQEETQKEQVAVLNWILMLLRWSRFHRKYDEESPIPFAQYVDREVRRTTRRLPYPVVALFSRADQLPGTPLPAADGFKNPGQDLYPIGQNPFFLAYHCLPDLFSSLLTHANHFRFDFAHSLVMNRVTGVIQDPRPCGVLSALEWLLEPRGRWMWSLPTRLWVHWHLRLDPLLGRRRWTELMEPDIT